jgi:hypothetical protein
MTVLIKTEKIQTLKTVWIFLFYIKIILIEYIF